MHNVNSPTTVPHISRTNVQHVITAVKKVILHVIVILKCKTINFQDLNNISISHDYDYITSIRPQDDHKVLMAH